MEDNGRRTMVGDTAKINDWIICPIGVGTCNRRKCHLTRSNLGNSGHAYRSDDRGCFVDGSREPSKGMEISARFSDLFFGA